MNRTDNETFSTVTLNWAVTEPHTNRCEDYDYEAAAPELMLLFEICKWCNGLIIILGLVSNSLIIVVLSRSRIGSEYYLIVTHNAIFSKSQTHSVNDSICPGCPT